MRAPPVSAARGLAFDLTQADLPTFAEHLPVTQAAILFARPRHRGQRRASDAAPFILHPLEVGALLFIAAYPDPVIAAGVLHDVIEDAGTTVAEICSQFGHHVAGLVAAVSEDASIADMGARKAALREAVRRAGGDAAAIFAADKLARVRELRTTLSHLRLADGPPSAVIEHQLDHYLASLQMLEETLAGQPLVLQLRFELETLQHLPPGR